MAKAEDTMPNQSSPQVQSHPYLAISVTGDGRSRQELLPEGRYDDAHGDRRSADQAVTL